MVVAVDSELAAELVQGTGVEGEFTKYLETIKAASDIDRLATDRPKSGVFLNRYAINPVNGEKLPIWASDYVLADYGTGAIMAVPAHDQRDLDFARAMKLPVRVVVETGEEDPNSSGVATVGDGKLVNSEILNGLSRQLIRSLKLKARELRLVITACAIGLFLASVTGVHRFQSFTVLHVARFQYLQINFH
jgi:leucyl-tRNA synthetase